jgi:hypothetical protein
VLSCIAFDLCPYDITLLLLLLLLLLQGHMVPMDQPAAALDMITRFMRNNDLADTDDIYSSTAVKQQVQQQPRAEDSEAAGLAVV